MNRKFLIALIVLTGCTQSVTDIESKRSTARPSAGVPTISVQTPAAESVSGREESINGTSTSSQDYLFDFSTPDDSDDNPFAVIDGDDESNATDDDSLFDFTENWGGSGESSREAVEFHTGELVPCPDEIAAFVLEVKALHKDSCFYSRRQSFCYYNERVPYPSGEDGMKPGARLVCATLANGFASGSFHYIDLAKDSVTATVDWRASQGTNQQEFNGDLKASPGDSGIVHVGNGNTLEWTFSPIPNPGFLKEAPLRLKLEMRGGSMTVVAENPKHGVPLTFMPSGQSPANVDELRKFVSDANGTLVAMPLTLDDSFVLYVVPKPYVGFQLSVRNLADEILLDSVRVDDVIEFESPTGFDIRLVGDQVRLTSVTLDGQ